MDISNLKLKQHLLMDYLSKVGYCANKLRSIEICIELVLTKGSSSNITSYEDLFFQEVQEQGHTPESYRFKSLRACLGQLKNFDLYGKYPDGNYTGFIYVTNGFDNLNDYYKSLAIYHLENGMCTGKRKNTVRIEYLCAILFYKHFQNNGAEVLEEATPKMICSFFHDGIKQIRGVGYLGHIRALMKILRLREPKLADYILNFLPNIPKAYKNFEFLSKDESDCIRKCLENPDNTLSLKERTIGWLLYFYGLRGSDITAMRFDNIDWRKDIITLIQSKTDYPLTLPLNAVTGNSLFDYITTERAESDINTIFIPSKNPHTPYKKIANIVMKIFKCAHVRDKGGCKGVRLFRHHFVTYLLSCGVECSVVSSLTGHMSPESLKFYADADHEHLKECALDISSYTIPSNLFDI
ncbi:MULTISPECIES: tyrosine-type recombinase/integrase [Bacteroides]|uniref:tyrosine-type recombinase/integrase n=1 Tax=Bacteroides TaxID=816 RepID=UPI0018A12403|nr:MULTISPECIES: tyrosine-type recombinase/integrase [Bacteroides]MDC2615771.1 tyrosine-type recombinase/integrase [Bacteroides ovatus]MDC2634989.1 tyrosine-type recombinase/integrase [Bacteroides ovatus]